MEDAAAVGKKRRKRRTEIKKIADKNARNVTFTKRRTGLFRRVDALSRRFRFDYFIVVFSPVGRAYSAGNPSLARRRAPAPAPTAAAAAGGASSSSTPAPALPSPDASDAADSGEAKPQEIIQPQAAAASSSAHVEADGLDGEKVRRLYIRALMKLRRLVADRIEFLKGLTVDNGTTFRHYI